MPTLFEVLPHSETTSNTNDSISSAIFYLFSIISYKVCSPQTVLNVSNISYITAYVISFTASTIIFTRYADFITSTTL